MSVKAIAHQACFSSSEIAPFENKYNFMLCQSCTHSDTQMSCHDFWKRLHFLPIYSSSPDVMRLLAVVQDKLLMEIGGLLFDVCSQCYRPGH